MKSSFRFSSLIIGAVFAAIAILGLFGQFDDGSHATAVGPFLAVVVGFSVIGGALATLRAR